MFVLGLGKTGRHQEKDFGFCPTSLGDFEQMNGMIIAREIFFNMLLLTLNTGSTCRTAPAAYITCGTNRSLLSVFLTNKINGKSINALNIVSCLNLNNYYPNISTAHSNVKSY